MEISWDQALAWRMHRQHLVDRARPADLLTVVERLGVLHAQVLSSAELMLWARIDGLERDAVRESLWDRRELVKLWVSRPTLHVVSSRELGLWCASTRLDRYVINHAGVADEAELRALVELVGEALHGALLTRTELAAELGRLSGSDALAERAYGSWGGGPLKLASFAGRLCFAPSDGQLVRFTNPASWLPAGVVAVDVDAARVEVARRYLGAYGPASCRELTCWLHLLPEVKRTLAALGEEVVEVDVEGERRWLLAEHLPELEATVPANTARLLPGFDQWVVGSGGRVPALLDPAHRRRVYRLQGWVSPVLLVNGRMAGVWRHERKGRRLRVEIEPFERTARWARREVGAEAERLAAFLGGGLDLHWVE